MANNEVSQVCSLPLPPAQYVSNFSEENIKRGRAPKPPPPVQDTYSMFGNTFNADDTIIRPLESQGIKRLYPQHFDRRRELRKLNHSLLVNFLDLLDLLVKCPESPRRAEKVEDLSLLFIHIHHLLNEFRPHQARETLRVMMDVQRRQRMETTQRFQKHLDKRNKSNATHLYLKKVTKSLKGRYSCEVSADAPSFRTAFFSGDMNIVVIPTGLPEVQLVKTKYRVGETLKAECISKDSRPAANLTWGINGQQLDSENVKKFSVIRDPDTDLETSISLLSIEVQRDHFSSTGRLKVRCTASISNVYWRTSERSAEEDRPKVLDAAQVRKPTELIFDTTPAPNSTGSRTICRWSHQGIIEPTILILNLLMCFCSLFWV